MASLNDIETKVQYIIGLLDARTTKTITGVLPLTFTTTEDKLRDWEIRGNDDIYDGQQGVGERTENLWNHTIEQGTILNTGVDEPSDTRVRSVEYIPVEQRQYTIKFDGADEVLIFGFDANKANAQLLYSGWHASAFTFTVAQNIAYIRTVFRFENNANIVPSDVTNIMLVNGSTAPSTYVPYGYEIPLSVNGTPQTFYIGNSPLTAGQSISKTSTGVDIATTEGENTISTTLYNKPEMTIKYK